MIAGLQVTAEQMSRLVTGLAALDGRGGARHLGDQVLRWDHGACHARGVIVSSRARRAFMSPTRELAEAMPVQVLPRCL
jgi:hypothetical protein